MVGGGEQSIHIDRRYIPFGIRRKEGHMCHVRGGKQKGILRTPVYRIPHTPPWRHYSCTQEKNKKQGPRGQNELVHGIFGGGEGLGGGLKGLRRVWERKQQQ